MAEHTEEIKVKRGEVYMADLKGYDIDVEDNVLRGPRPVLVIQNEIGNNHSPNVIVAKITGTQSHKNKPVHQKISLKIDSTIYFESVATISKSKLKYKMGELTSEEMLEAEKKLALSIGLDFYMPEEVKVLSKNIITKPSSSSPEEEIVSKTFNVWVKTKYRTKEVYLDYDKHLKKLDITLEAPLLLVEQKLNTLKGIQVINEAIKQGSCKFL